MLFKLKRKKSKPKKKKDTQEAGEGLLLGWGTVAQCEWGPRETSSSEYMLLCGWISYYVPALLIQLKKKKCLSKWWSPWPPCGARASPETEDQLEGSGRGCGERWWWLHLWPWWWRWIQARLSTFRPTVARKTVCIRGGHWACLTLSALSLWKEGFLGSFQVLKASKFPRMLNPSQRGGHGYGHVSLSYPHATVTSDL